MQKRTNQGGSVLTFVIVGIALAALVGGGIYLVNQRNKQDGTAPAPTTSEPTQQPSSGASGSSGAPSTSTPASPSTGGTQSRTPTTGVQGNRLPATGPADTGLQLLAVALLIGVTTSYIQSQVRRKRQAALL